MARLSLAAAFALTVLTVKCIVGGNWDRAYLNAAIAALNVVAFLENVR